MAGARPLGAGRSGRGRGSGRSDDAGGGDRLLGARHDSRPIQILVVCTANICRSPIVEALLRQRFTEQGVAVRVHSAGMLHSGVPASVGSTEVLRNWGFDLSEHRSQRLTAALVQDADLVIGLAREHVREAVALVPHAWGRTYTLKELVRRGSAAGARQRGELLDAWLARVAEGRSRGDALGSSRHDDIADPYGGPSSGYERAAREMKGLVELLVRLVCPPAPDRHQLRSRATADPD